MKKIVSKFGGTSMGDAVAIKRSAEIAISRKSFVVVVSATSGTTNLLVEMTQGKNHLAQITEKHFKIADDLNISLGLLSPLLDELKNAKNSDEILSFGERLSSVLITETLKNSGVPVQLIDAREIMITDDDFGKARPLLDKIALKAKEKLPFGKTVYVTQGFIGATEDGRTTTLGRGGSDYSAALFAEAVGAEALEIWTDVAGIATTDPRLCREARPLEEISFKEASELAVFGAKILHPATLAPAMRKNIPVFVGSSFAAEEKGTWIKKESTSAPLLRALALRKNQVLMTLTTPDMLNSHGFLFKIFQIFNNHKISVDAITTSEISVALTLDGQKHVDQKLISDLSQFAEVQVEENLSLVALIGNNINHTPGLAQKVFSIIPEINVRMICQGASKHNFCFLISDASGPDAIQRLHRGFIPNTLP